MAVLKSGAECTGHADVENFGFIGLNRINSGLKTEVCKSLMAIKNRIGLSKRGLVAE
jgi:hypothetical protein